MADDAHLPVLLDEVINWLRPEEGGIFIDCTVGMAGHSKALLEASDAVTVIGIDRDAESLELATTRLETYGERFKPVHADYKNIQSVLAGVEPVIEPDMNSRVEGGGKRGSGSDQRRGPANAHSSTANEEGALKSTLKVWGILADFGISSYQLDQAERGFSFTQDAPLDMRMDRSSGETAADLVNDLNERELADLIFEYGEERGSRKIARAIVREREKSRIETSSQ
ncbi:MAG: 16S rRNA (cytosine(1402)-N(4))-methyltransferase, partial [Blastocatellia bacterium]